MGKAITLKAVKRREVIAHLKKAEGSLLNELHTELKVSAVLMESDAKRLVPVNLGVLRSSTFGRAEPKELFLGANAEYAGAIEFGTLGKVKIPNELKELAGDARQIMQGGSFETMLESIKEWCRNNGIDRQAAYPIALKLIKEGQEPQPFLWPAWQKNIKKIFANLKNITKKYSGG